MDDTVAAARAVVDDATATRGIRIEDLHDLRDLDRATDLFDTVWGRDPEAGTIVATEILRAMEHAGCQVSGAFDGARLVGATAAFVGWDGQRPHLHSHITGVLPQDQGRGIGWSLKQYQRWWALEHGIDHVRWTYDPLIRRNAVLNLVRLGARAVAYAEDLYGAMADARNRGLPTDRLVVDWDLRERRVQLAAEGREAEPDLGRLRHAGAEETLRVGSGAVPQLVASDADRRLVQVPEDIEALREADPDLARAWSAAIREALGSPLRQGFRISGCTRDGWYVLVRSRGVEELAS